MRTLFLNFFILTIVTFTFFSCGKESPIEPQSINSVQTDGAENPESFNPLIQYWISQSFNPYPLTKDANNPGGNNIDAVTVELVIAEGQLHVGASTQYNTWYGEGVNFTPNQTLIIGNTRYVPANATITVASRYVYGPLGGGDMWYKIRNEFWAGSTHLATFGDLILPFTMPVGGYYPPVVQTYTTTGNAENHELQFGYWTYHP